MYFICKAQEGIREIGSISWGAGMNSGFSSRGELILDGKLRVRVRLMIEPLGPSLHVDSLLLDDTTITVI